MRKPILALDFDGVIHSYTSGWKGAHIIPDPPVEGSGAYLLRVIPDFTIAIFSSRSRSVRGRIAMRQYVRNLLRDACFADSEALHTAWVNTQGKPADWIPWTAGDVNEAADWIFKAIRWPWVKPPAVMTIDDRAITFNGDWSDPAYHPHAIWTFRPWNKRAGSTSSGETPGKNLDASLTPTIPTALT
jgi:hypothetical protein